MPRNSQKCEGETNGPEEHRRLVTVEYVLFSVTRCAGAVSEGGGNQMKEARPTPRLKFQETRPAQCQVCEIPLVLEKILHKLLALISANGLKIFLRFLGFVQLVVATTARLTAYSVLPGVAPVRKALHLSPTTLGLQ